MKEYTTEQKTVLLQRLNEISPRWTKHISIHDGYTSIENPEHGLSIWNPTCCILGEAHGFNSDQSFYPLPNNTECMDCANFCGLLVPLTYAFQSKPHRRICNMEAWEELENFVNHFEIVHKKPIPFKESLTQEIISK